jgi:light-regulated signal transduction histidine kinase (bacteriophytochrome)
VNLLTGIAPQIALGIRNVRIAEGGLQQIRRLNAELEQRVEARTAALEEANRELESFSYSVSHDLRAPLRAIEGFSRILVEEHAPTLGVEGRRLLGVVSANARRMAQLIDDLLAFSRLGRADLRAGSVDMQALAGGVFEELCPPDSRERVRFEIEPLPCCRGDAALLRQVWANLLGNALKFTSKREHAQIDVGGERRGEEIVYHVRDNGVGFDMAYADKLFGVFQRLHGPEQFEGTGVGLAIVQRIVRRHGGRAWAEGTPEQGATFSFALPGGRADGRPGCG